MPKRNVVVTERPNGARVESRIVRHRDGKVSLKKRTISLPQINFGVAPEAKRAPDPADQEPASTKTQKRKAKKAAKDIGPKLATAPTTRERTHHQHAVDGSAYVTTTNMVPKMLRRCKARTGEHVEAFQRDYEIAGSSLRSPGLDVSTGGSGLALPLAQIQAVDRLKEFRERNERAFVTCEAVLIYGTSPAEISRRAGVAKGIAYQVVRDSVDELANFYTPAKRRPDRYLAAVARIVEEARLKS